MRLPMGYVLPPSTKKQIKDLARTSWLMPVLLALGDHAIILALAIIGYLMWDGLPWPLAAITTAMIYIVQARGLRGLENLVHDGSHFNWARKHKWTNDLMTNLLAAWPVFSSVAEYRRGHLRHHNEFGSDADPDHVRYQQLSVSTLDRSRLMAFSFGLAARMGTYIAGWWMATGTNLRICVCGSVAERTVVCRRVWRRRACGAVLRPAFALFPRFFQSLGLLGLHSAVLIPPIVSVWTT